ncbi:hypothetical protein [Vallicoccus soli]|uniref:hypothetical protein n=1 Tax=Vallicoccus soli TaxID=2339232 RepID=UPI0014037A37|nr:hypothetical protein [Vallicoccus soli]
MDRWDSSPEQPQATAGDRIDLDARTTTRAGAPARRAGGMLANPRRFRYAAQAGAGREAAGATSAGA